MKIAVIGEGIAGLSAALMAQAKGHQVTIFTKGMGGLGISNGTGDVLGYVGEEAVSGSPFSALEKVPQEHPYRAIGVANVQAGMEWLREALPDFFLAPAEGNAWLPTAIGALRPTYLVPRSCEHAIAKNGAAFLVVGLKQYKDFPAELIADNLSRAEQFSITARAVKLDFTVRPGEPDVNGTDYARALDTQELDPTRAAQLRSKLADLINKEVREGETVLIPAIMGLNADAFADFAAKVQAPVAEVPTVPPSILGRRIFDLLVNKCREKRIDIRLNSAARGAVTAGSRVERLEIRRAGGSDMVRVDGVIDAAGGFASGNITRNSHLEMAEAIFDLPLFTPDPGEISGLHEIDVENRRYVAAVLMAGVKVNEQMLPIGDGGKPEYSNVYCVGDLLGGAAPWRELCGEGIALGSAYAAVNALDTQERGAHNA